MAYVEGAGRFAVSRAHGPTFTGSYYEAAHLAPGREAGTSSLAAQIKRNAEGAMLRRVETEKRRLADLGRRIEAAKPKERAPILFEALHQPWLRNGSVETRAAFLGMLEKASRGPPRGSAFSVSRAAYSANNPLTPRRKKK